MNAFRKLKMTGIFLALLLAISGCSSNSVPTISPVTSDDSKQVQTPTVPAVSQSPTPPPEPVITTPAPTSAKATTVAPSPAKPPVVAPSPAPKQTEQGSTVYVTKTGEKYHRDGCRYLSKSKIPISLSDAKSGYGPCSVCNPPH